MVKIIKKGRKVPSRQRRRNPKTDNVGAENIFFIVLIVIFITSYLFFSYYHFV